MKKIEHDGALRIGEKFQFARQKKSLRLTEVANLLKLNLNKIIALESGSLLEIPTNYLRGYLFAYAKLLDIPEQEIASEFSSLNTSSSSEHEGTILIENPPPAPLQSLSQKKQRNLTTLLTILGILVIVGWFLNHEKNVHFKPADQPASMNTQNN